MIDREKVIKGLECCEDTGWTSCHTCPYYRGDIGACVPKLKSDVLVLLKAQEPIEPIQDMVGDALFWVCGKCGHDISSTDWYCPNCGRKVQWE